MAHWRRRDASHTARTHKAQTRSSAHAHKPHAHAHCTLPQDGLAERIGAGEVPTKIREAPFVQIPLGVTEDRLVGTVDIEASMKVRACRVAGPTMQGC